MRDETERLVDTVEEAGSYHDVTDIITRTRGLWNYERNGEDCDVELKIGYGADVRSIIESIDDDEEWSIRFIGTPSSDQDYNLSIAFVHRDSVVASNAFF